MEETTLEFYKIAVRHRKIESWNFNKETKIQILMSNQ